jgi:LysM repeat protein
MKFLNMRNLLILISFLVISGAHAMTPPCDEPAESGFHVVQQGETLFRIAQQYRVSVSELQRWNELSTDLIQPCQKIRVAPSAEVALTPVSPTPDNITQARGPQSTTPAWKTTNGQHIVQAGETIAGLAAMYGYTESRFRLMNSLGATDALRTGQVLMTTDCFVAQGAATVVTGSMLSAYADAVQASATSPDPAADEASTGEVLTPRSGDASTTVRRNIHVVNANEQLIDIARQYNISIAQLRGLNNMEPGETVMPGQRIIVQ